MQQDIKMPWVAVVSFPQAHPPAEAKHYIGTGRDILLEGFHWESHLGARDPATGARKSWYRIIEENAAAIKAAGFTWVWFPPPSDSLAPQGYIPRRWNVLDTAYGTESELRAALRALDPVKGMADVVINHRVGVHTSGADFDDPPFADNRAAIARDDSSGVGTGHPDSGEHHAAGRDLDHHNPDVRNAIKTYLRKLKGVGFQGWRYDLTKGYAGQFIAEYNDATGGKTTAFDFPTRYLLYESCLSDDYGRLCCYHNGRVAPGGLMGFWPSRSVTFLDNHDTEYRRDYEHSCHNDGTRHFPGETVGMGYAYILTHPGTPCVFWSHFFDWGQPTRQRIERLIHLRKHCGIHCRSHVEIKEASPGLYAAIIDGKVAMKMGRRGWSPGGGWHLVVDGERFAVWMRGN